MAVQVKIILVLLTLLAGCGPSDPSPSKTPSVGQAAAGAFNPAQVPDDLRDLAPLAQKWGIGDDLLRNELIDSASPAELQALRDAVLPKMDRITQWLDSFPPDALSPEAAAFMYLLEVVDELANE
jgi:hypothetical protein